jgi:hypothetical protein
MKQKIMKTKKFFGFALILGAVMIVYACSQYAGREAVKPEKKFEQLSFSSDSVFITIPDPAELSAPNYFGPLYYTRDTVYYVSNSATYPCFVTMAFDTLELISYLTVSSSMLMNKNLTLVEYEADFDEEYLSAGGGSDCKRQCEFTWGKCGERETSELRKYCRKGKRDCKASCISAAVDDSIGDDL